MSQLPKNLARIAALAAAAKATGPDLTKESTGGDFKLPDEGACRLRFVEYREIGVHTTEWNKVKKTKPRAWFGFEVSGPKHPPITLPDGRTIAQTIRFKEVIGQHAKNGYMKLFKKMTEDHPNATNFVELLGQAYRGKIVHSEKKEGKRQYANLKDDAGYTISSPKYEDPETGELKEVLVAPVLGDVSAFLWEYSDLEDWDAMYVDGTYDDGGSKNAKQNEIKRAENWVGSNLYNLLVEAGREADTIPAPLTEKQKAEAAAEEDADDEAKPAKAEPAKVSKSALETAADDEGADPLAGM